MFHHEGHEKYEGKRRKMRSWGGCCLFEGELDLAGGDAAFAEDDRGFCGAVNYGGGCGVGARAGIEYGVDGVTAGAFPFFDRGGVFFAALVGAGSDDRFGQKLEQCCICKLSYSQNQELNHLSKLEQL